MKLPAKGILPIFLGTAIFMTGYSQDPPASLSGTVIYEETVQMDIQVQGVDASLTNALPKERKSRKVLIFSENEALYENDFREEPEEVMEMEGEQMIQIRMAEPMQKVYTDFRKKVQIEQKEFMTRIFLIERSLEENEWKLTGAQKRIMDYPCMEAVSSHGEQEVRAWFTPEIAIPAGPGTFGNLPGLILAMEFGDGDRTLTAISLEKGEVDQELLTAPRRGKKVTPEEYQAMVDEKMEEMGVEGGQGRNQTWVIKVRTEE